MIPLIAASGAASQHAAVVATVVATVPVWVSILGACTVILLTIGAGVLVGELIVRLLKR